MVRGRCGGWGDHLGATSVSENVFRSKINADTEKNGAAAVPGGTATTPRPSRVSKANRTDEEHAGRDVLHDTFLETKNMYIRV